MAKQAIQHEFMRMYAYKDYNKMTIKELCTNTPAARTTFYSYYHNLDDLKAEIEDELIGGINRIAEEISGGNLPAMDFSDFFGKTLAYIHLHHEDFYAFLIAQPNFRFIEKWKGAIKENFRLRFPEKTQKSNYDLVAEMVASAIIGAYAHGLKYPETIDAVQLNRLITSAVEAVRMIL